MKDVAASYADALLALASDAKQALAFEKVLFNYVDMYNANTELRDFLCNPVIARAAQKDALLKLAPKGAPKPVLNCLCLMADKGRICYLPLMAEAYKEHRAALLGTLLIHVRTPAPLDEAETEQIKKVFTQRFAANGAEVDIVIDPTLIGGVQIQIGDMLYDQSLSGRLKQLRHSLVG